MFDIENNRFLIFSLSQVVAPEGLNASDAGLFGECDHSDATVFPIEQARAVTNSLSRGDEESTVVGSTKRETRRHPHLERDIENNASSQRIDANDSTAVVNCPPEIAFAVNCGSVIDLSISE